MLRPLYGLLLLLFVAAPAWACLWDRDTLLEEQRGLPTVAAILAGKWEQHSQFYYEHRLTEARAALDRDPADLAAMDDLAVALEKLGRTDEAIKVMQSKLEIDPDGYTTHANLGTFYLHSGDFEDGIRHIERALEINPDAHFGRERYQLMVAKHLQRAGDDPSRHQVSFIAPVLLQDEADEGAIAQEMERKRRYRAAPSAQIDDAIEGVVGMIRFGTGRSPHLFFALGDLLALRGDRHLAYRAYHRARQLGYPDPAVPEAAMEQVKEAHERDGEFAMELIEAEQAAGEQWVAAYQAYEDELLRQGRDLTDPGIYEPFYDVHGHIRAVPAGSRSWFGTLLWLIPAGLVLAVTLPIALMLINRQRRRRLMTPG